MRAFASLKGTALALVVGTTIGVPGAAQTPPTAPSPRISVVQGSTIDSAGAPVPDVEVSVVALGVSVRTNERGAFRLSVSPAGTYALRLRRIGYQALVIEISVTRPIISLAPIVLRAVPIQLEELAVEGKLPTPTFMLRPGFHVSARFQSGPKYQTWDTHGAALSPNAFLVLRHLAPGGAFARLYGWYDSPN